MSMTSRAPPRCGTLYLRSLVGAEVGKATAAHKLYILEEAVGDAPSVWWEVRRVFDHFGVSTPLARWWAQIQELRALTFLGLLGFPSAEVRHSQKAAAARAAAGQDINDDGPTFAEMVFSTRVLLALLAEWTTSLRKAKGREFCRDVLNELVQGANRGGGGGSAAQPGDLGATRHIKRYPNIGDLGEALW